MGFMVTNPDAWRMKIKIMCLLLSQKWRGLFHFNWLVNSDLPVQTCTTQYTIKQLSQAFTYISYHTLCWGLFNLTFDIPNLWLLTYALTMSLIIVHTLYISTYHNLHALVHISTCTCTFQRALVYAFVHMCLVTSIICITPYMHVSLLHKCHVTHIVNIPLPP